MLSLRKEPCSLLQPYVDCYFITIQTDYNSPPLKDKFIPSSGTGLVFHFADPFSIVESDHKELLPKSFFVGHAKKFVNILSGPIIDSIVIKFKPHGFYQLFSYPSDVLSQDSYISATEIDGNSMEMLYEITGAEPETEKRIKIIEQYLTQKIEKKNIQLNNRIDFAIDCIIKNKGCMKMEQLYELTNMCERTFQRDFLKQIGIPAKSFARLIRVNNIIKLSQQVSDDNWFDILLQFGYFDQAHLIHDFKSVTGEAPMLFFNKDLTQTRIISASF